MSTATTYRITRVVALPERRLHVEYAGGTVAEVNMAPLIAKSRAFRHLADSEKFAAVAVGDYGWSAVWDDTAELDSDRLMDMALEQAGRIDTLAFRQWQERNGLSLTDAAKAIGLSRRTVSQYRTGSRPVPRTVYLACKGWEAEKRAA
ncbi:MAG: helix-turn-helix transcriptional regulator [Sulfuricellaceae bacterium]